MAVEFKKVDDQSTGQRLDNYLVKILKGVPKSFIYRIIRKGEVRVNKGRKKPDYKLILGDIVRIPPVQITQQAIIEPSSSLTQILINNTLYEDDDLMIVNKPSGLASHGGSGITIGLIEALRQMHNPKLELVHRIDRGTSGCILIAKKRSILLALQTQLCDHAIKKVYWALLKGAWQKKQHKIEIPLLKNTNNRNQKVSVNANGQVAISDFHPLKNIHQTHYSLCMARVVIQTGRTHQIRVHAQYANHPIIGDDKYGDFELNKQLGINRLCLHAHQLQFTHPKTNKYLTIEAPVDVSLLARIDAL